MAVAVLTITGCSGSGTEAASGTTVPGPRTPVTPMPMPAWCTPATPEQVEDITMNLAGTGNQLVDAFTFTSGAGYTMVVANLDSATGERLSSADVWAWHPSGELYAISSGARDYSILPSLADNPVSDPGIVQTTDCLIASAQARNLG